MTHHHYLVRGPNEMKDIFSPLLIFLAFIINMIHSTHSRE